METTYLLLAWMNGLGGRADLVVDPPPGKKKPDVSHSMNRMPAFERREEIFKPRVQSGPAGSVWHAACRFGETDGCRRVEPSECVPFLIPGEGRCERKREEGREIEVAGTPRLGILPGGGLRYGRGASRHGNLGFLPSPVVGSPIPVFFAPFQRYQGCCRQHGQAASETSALKGE